MKHRLGPGRQLRAVLAGVAILVATSPALTGCSSGQASSGGTSSAGLTTVNTVTMSSTATHWREMVAQSKGFFADEGLKVVETVANPQVSVTAVISGDAQIGFSDAGGVAQADDKGASLEFVASGLDKADYSFVTAPGVKSVAELRGKTIASTAETDVYTQVIFQILKNAGVDKSQVNMIYGEGSDDRASALQGGAIQGALLPPPADHRLQSAGFNILANTSQIVPLMTLSATVVNRSWANQHPDLVKAYIKAIAKASDWLYDPANKAEAVKILATDTKSSTADAESAYKAYIAGKAFNKGACMQKPALQALLNRMKQIGTVNNTNAADYMTNKYCG